MKLWITNTEGKPDAILTMTFIGFIVILLKYVVSDVTLNILSFSLNFGNVDAASMAALLAPTLGAYVARRFTDKKFPCPCDLEGKPTE
jgi:hypothetical protein